MLAVQNIRHFFMCYKQQRRNYVARRNKILVCINRNLEKRKDIFLKILDLLNLQASLQELVPKQRTRRFRRFCRNNKNWWKTVSQTYSQRRFKHTFRVSRTTFNFILSKIQHRIQKEYVTEEPIPPWQKLAICLYRLGRGDYLYTIAEMVGLAESPVCQIVVEVCKAIVEELWSEAVEHHFTKSD